MGNCRSFGPRCARYSPSPARLLREFIDIVERRSASDFVLKLPDGVADAVYDAALRDYVVRDRSLASFGEAVWLIRSAVEGHAPKIAYLYSAGSASRSRG